MILVTGVNGFIGKHLLTSLIKQKGRDKVLALTSKPVDECAYLLHRDYSFGADYFYSSGFDRIETVIHAGAFTPKSGAEANDVNGCASNVTNTTTLINSLPESVRTFVFLSTLDVYGITDERISESSKVEPVSLYGKSKLFCEDLLASWCSIRGVDYKLLRIGHTYGPGEEAYQKIIPQTFKKVLSNESPQIWGDGSDLRSFIYIDDVIRLILSSLMTSGSIGPVNIVGRNSCSIKELVNLILEVSGKNLKVEYKKSSAVKRDLLFDTSLMNDLLGDEQISLIEGLKAEWHYLNEMKH